MSSLPAEGESEAAWPVTELPPIEDELATAATLTEAGVIVVTHPTLRGVEPRGGQGHGEIEVADSKGEGE